MMTGQEKKEAVSSFLAAGHDLIAVQQKLAQVLGTLPWNVSQED